MIDDSKSIIIDYDDDKFWYTKIFEIDNNNRYIVKKFDNSIEGYSWSILKKHIVEWLEDNNINYSVYNLYSTTPRKYIIVLEFESIDAYTLFSLMWK